MPPSSFRPLVAVPLGLLALAAAAPAAQANFVGLGQDPAGDAADPHPGRDIVSVGTAYDRRTGHLRGGVRLRGEPGQEAPANLTLFAGNRTPTGCNAFPAIGFGTQTNLTGADWVRLDRAGGAPAARGSAKKLYDVATEEYEATTKDLAGRRPDCVIAQLNEPGNPANVYDVAGPFALKGLPELEVRLGKAPAIFRSGKPRTIRATVRNVGDGPTGRVRLAVPGAKGLKVAMPKRLNSIRPGARRTVSLRVTLSSRSESFTTLRLRATGADGVRAEADDRLYRSSRTGGSSGGGGGAGSGNGGSKLCYRYHWLPPYSKLEPC